MDRDRFHLHILPGMPMPVCALARQWKLAIKAGWIRVAEPPKPKRKKRHRPHGTVPGDYSPWPRQK